LILPTPAEAGDVSQGDHNRGEKILMDLLREIPTTAT
jgi:hypothetical protein